MACALGVALTGCPAGDATKAGAAGSGQASSAEKGNAAGAGGARSSGKASTTPVRAPLAPAPWRIPVGPALSVVPGKGLGPIRFGARLETVERLIGEPCEEKKEESAGVVVCRYSAQAVDFFLEKGAVTRMKAHRLGRLFRAEPKLEYGIFNGRFAEEVSVGMLPAAVRELLGEPKAVRKVEDGGPFGTVEIHDYPEFSLEYDRLSPERVVLGGIDLKVPSAKGP